MPDPALGSVPDPGHAPDPHADFPFGEDEEEGEPREPRGQVALILGVVAAILLAVAGFVVARDLTSPDEEPAAETVPTTVATVPSWRDPGPGGREPLPEGCRSATETPRPLASEAAVRELCGRYGDQLRKDTKALFDCRIDDRVEDCRPAARRAWSTLTALRTDPSFHRASVVLDPAVALADENGRHYLGRTCTGRNDPKDQSALDCNAGYATFGLGLNALEQSLRAA